MITKEKTNSNCAPPGKSINEFPSKTLKFKDFELKIIQGEKTIIFNSSEIEDLSATLYKAELTLEDLYKLNDLFSSFKSIERVFTRFFQKLDESKIVIKKEDNQIHLTFIIEFMGDKDEAKIILIPEQGDINDIVMKLCDKVKEIDSLKKEFNDYKTYAEKKFNELESLIKKDSETIKNNIEFYNGKYMEIDEYNKLKEKCSKFKETIDTKIMRYDELYLIKEGVHRKLKKKIKKYSLLFRASRNGFTSSDFHSYCDGKNNTVTFVETLDGRRFGGFTDAQWDQSSSWKTGSNGFLFSLDNKEIYYNKNSSYNIYGHSSYGPYFGSGADFYISNNCNTNQSGESSGQSYDTNGKKHALSGSSNFFVKDYEVYQLEYE